MTKTSRQVLTGVVAGAVYNVAGSITQKASGYDSDKEGSLL